MRVNNTVKGKKSGVGGGREESIGGRWGRKAHKDEKEEKRKGREGKEGGK